MYDSASVGSCADGAETFLALPSACPLFGKSPGLPCGAEQCQRRLFDMQIGPHYGATRNDRDTLNRPRACRINRREALIGSPRKARFSGIVESHQTVTS